MHLNHSTFCSYYSHHTHLPRRNHKIYYSKKATSHFATTPSLQCYITQLPSTPTLWKFSFRCQYFSGHGKPKHNQHIIIRFLCMVKPRETWKWEPASTLSQHSLNSIGSTLQTHGKWHSTYHTLYITWRVNRGYSINLDTVFSYRSLQNSYRIAYTSRIRDLLLLFLMVSTCLISVPTFTTRYHTIYNCGWWCRGSTHLQMQWQGSTTCKISQESWPTYGVSTYTDRKLI